MTQASPKLYWFIRINLRISLCVLLISLSHRVFAQQLHGHLLELEPWVTKTAISPLKAATLP